MLMCEAFYSTKDPEVIIGHDFTLYKFKYKDHPFQFKHDQLLNSDAFNIKALEVGLNTVAFEDWQAYVNEVQNKAIIYTETDYPPYVEAAKEYCRTLLETEDFEEQDGLHWFPESTIKNKIKKIELFEKILKEKDIKKYAGYDVSDKCGQFIWKFDSIKLKEFAEWKT